jgi:NTE family protein
MEMADHITIQRKQVKQMQAFLKLKWLFLLPLFCCLDISYSAAQTGVRPKIGITLSGGGAKGLAHIGLLKAIDSAGLQVDYVTGTSMGAVVGSLYAAGYSADTILKITKQLDWGTVLTNTPRYNSVLYTQKEDYGRYLLEVPIVGGKPSIRRGILESNELWLTLSELLLPFYLTTDFHQLKRGFECIATNLENGDMVVLNKGNLVKAVRASMAIPSVFTPVEYDSMVLVDGGLVRNFPVSNVRAMGASIVIGSNVSGGLSSSKEINNPIEVITQVAFFKETEDFRQQRPLTDVYVEYPIEKFGAAAFASSAQIIQIGIDKGLELYPVFKRMKDSLDAIYGPQPGLQQPRSTDSVFLQDYEINGLDQAEVPFFLKALKFVPGKNYNLKELSNRLRMIFGAEHFHKTTYSLVPTTEDKAKVLFDIDKRPALSARVGFHYNTTIGIGVKVGLVKRSIFGPFSSGSASFAIGENPRALIRYQQFLTSLQRVVFEGRVYAESTDIFSYNNKFERFGLYNQRGVKIDISALRYERKHWAWGIGQRFEMLRYKPKLPSELEARGTIRFFESFIFGRQTTTDDLSFPRRGRRFTLEVGHIYEQLPLFSLSKNGQVYATQDSSIFVFSPYQQVKLSLDQYFKTGSNSFVFSIYTGMNLARTQAVLNDFAIGGLTEVIRNQVPFAGLPEASLTTGSALNLQLGYQYKVSGSLYVIGKINHLWYNFIKSNYQLGRGSSGIGYAVTAGFRSFVGPIEASVMYSDISKRITPYFNIGFPLGR